MLGELLVGGVVGALLFSRRTVEHHHTSEVIYRKPEEVKPQVSFSVHDTKDPYEDLINEYRGMVFHTDLEEILNTILPCIPNTTDAYPTLARVLSDIFEERVEVRGSHDIKDLSTLNIWVHFESGEEVEVKYELW